MLTTTKATKTNIAAISTYESIGYVFPIGDPESPAACGTTGPTPNPDGPACAFGPILVPLEDFKKLAKLKKIQFMWGDNRPETEPFVHQSRLCAKLINKYGGNAEVVKLGDIPALKGSTHIPFADMDNDKVAAQLDGFLKKAGLDRIRASTITTIMWRTTDNPSSASVKSMEALFVCNGSAGHPPSAELRAAKPGRASSQCAQCQLFLSGAFRSQRP